MRLTIPVICVGRIPDHTNDLPDPAKMLFLWISRRPNFH
jgi:hypothetical protein